MRVIQAAEIDAVLDPPSLADALAVAFTQDIVVPVRHHHAVDRTDAPATLLLMPAWTGGDASQAFMGVKLVSIFQGNAARGCPASSALIRRWTGNRRAARRHGRRAADAVAHGGRLGAGGAIARAGGCRAHGDGGRRRAGAVPHPRHRAQRSLTDIALWNHRPARAEAMANDLAATGLPVRAITDLEAAVRHADIVSTATLEQRAAGARRRPKPGAHLDCVGAFTPAMRESDDEAVRRATLFCDTRAGALKEGGDLACPLGDGVITADDVKADLHDLCAGRHAGRAHADEITFFKSVGSAIEDLAAAALRLAAHRSQLAFPRSDCHGRPVMRGNDMGHEIKICGVATPKSSTRRCLAAPIGWDWRSFPKSPRNLSLLDAAELGARVRGRAGKVALCVDAPDSVIAAIVEALRPRPLAASRPGNARADSRNRARFGVPVMKAIGSPARPT
jgi:ornithine cyclodeaminase